MTNDFIEDACDILDKSGSPYIILVGDEVLTKVFSNIGKENIEMIKEWIDNGHIINIFKEHIKIIEDKS